MSAMGLVATFIMLARRRQIPGAAEPVPFAERIYLERRKRTLPFPRSLWRARSGYASRFVHRGQETRRLTSTEAMEAARVSRGTANCVFVKLAAKGVNRWKR